MRIERWRDGRGSWVPIGVVVVLGWWAIGCAATLADDETAETAAPPAGKVYFISPIGTAEAAGTKDQPFAAYAQARAVLRAGDTLHYRAGVYTDPKTFIAYDTKLNGAAGERITIRPCPGESVAFDNQGRNGALAYVGGEGAVVERFEFRNSDSRSDRPEDALGGWTVGVAVWGRYATFRHNWIHDIVGDGIGNQGSLRMQTAMSCVIHNNAFTDLRHNGKGYRGNVAHILGISGGNHVIHSNYFSMDEPGSGACGLRFKHALDPGKTAEVYNNTFENIPGAAVDLTGAGGWNVHHNLFLESNVAPMGQGFVWQYNTLITKQRPALGFGGGQQTFRWNIVYQTAESYAAADGFHTVRVAHYASDAAHAGALRGDKFDSNCYYNPNLPCKFAYFAGPPKTTGGVYTLAQWKALSPGRDANSVEADPQFVDMAGRDFRTKPGSPAAAMGVYAGGAHAPPLTAKAARAW